MTHTHPPILVTGATGNVGKEVLRFLLARNASVIAAVRNPAQERSAMDACVRLAEFDFMRPETFATALHGVKRVFLVRPPQISEVKRYIQPFIEAMQDAGVEQVVFLSILGVEKNPVVPHHKIERLIMASGMAYTFLRASFFMQNLDTTHRKEISEGSIIVPAGRGKTSFIDVRDIAEVGAKALTETAYTNANVAYDLTGAEALTYYDVAETLTEVLGKPIRHINPSILRFFRLAKQNHLPTGQVIVMIALYTSARLGLAGRTTEEVQRLLGRPPISLRQYAEDYKHCWQ